MSPPSAFKCRSCGALLVAAPAPPAPAPAPPAPLPASVAPVAPPAPTSSAETVATATAVDDRFFAPTTFTPATFTTAPADKKRVPTGAVIVVLALLVAGVIAFKSLGSHSSSKTAKTPVALSPLSDSDQGLPSLADAVRAQAEGGRQRAFSDVNQALAASPDGRVDVAMLKQVDATIAFLTGSESSTSPKQASFSQSDDTLVVAVSTASKDVCAYERQVGTSDPEVVTMGNVSSCRANDAPATGWIPLQNAGTSRGAVLPQN
jgi:hypothetical protein